MGALASVLPTYSGAFSSTLAFFALRLLSAFALRFFFCWRPLLQDWGGGLEGSNEGLETWGTHFGKLN